MTRFAIRAAILAAVLACGLWLPAVVAQPSSGFENPKVVLLKSGNDVGYLAPKDPKYNDVRARLMKRRILEEFREFLSPLRLPKTLFLLTEQCPIGPHYLRPLRRLAICYEFVDDLDFISDSLLKAMSKQASRLPKGITFTKQEMVAGILAGVLLHELGHALFDILDVPMFGREEDAADQMTAFIALQFSPEVARSIVKTFALFWLAEGDPFATVSPRQTPGEKPLNCHRDPICGFADNHGTGSQRMYNTICLGYGRDPVLFRDFVESGWLPKERAANCPDEYQQVRWAFEKTIMPFIDEAQTARVRSRNWFLQGETEPANTRLPGKTGK